jgi:hypothetical protein
MSAARNTRLAWMAQELARGQTSATIVLNCMTKFPGVSEKTARRDLKELLVRLNEIELEMLPEVKHRMMEIGFKLMNDSMSVAQYGPAANIFKTLSVMTGAIDLKGTSTDSEKTQGQPDASQVRDRIKKLMESKKIKAEAEAAGIDLTELKKDA